MQKHHGAREIFLTQQSDANCAISLLRKCKVCPPDEYEDCNAGTEEVEANNVYLCEYQYDTVWQARPLLPDHLFASDYSFVSTATHGPSPANSQESSSLGLISRQA